MITLTKLDSGFTKNKSKFINKNLGITRIKHILHFKCTSGNSGLPLRLLREKYWHFRFMEIQSHCEIIKDIFRSKGML